MRYRLNYALHRLATTQVYDIPVAYKLDYIQVAV